MLKFWAILLGQEVTMSVFLTMLFKPLLVLAVMPFVALGKMLARRIARTERWKRIWWYNQERPY